MDAGAAGAGAAAAAGGGDADARSGIPSVPYAANTARMWVSDRASEQLE